MQLETEAPNARQDFHLESAFEARTKRPLSIAIRTHTSFFLMGPRGCGKTTYANRLLALTRTPYININCIFADKRQTFLAVLCYEIRAAFLGDYRPTVELEEGDDLTRMPVSTNFQKLIKWLQIVAADENNPFMKRVKQAGGMYVLVDNFEEFKSSEKFINNLFVMIREYLPFRMSFIFVAINTDKPSMFFEAPFSAMDRHFMNPDVPFLRQILQAHYEKSFYDGYKKRQSQLKSTFEHIVSVLSSFVAEGMGITDRNINIVRKVGSAMFQRIIDYFDEEFAIPPLNNKEKQLLTIEKALYSKQIAEEWRLFTANSTFSEVEFTRLREEHDAIKTKNLIDNVSKNARTVQSTSGASQQTSNSDILVTPDHSYVFYPTLLRSSLLLAENTLPAEDRRRFKDIKLVGNRRDKKAGGLRRLDTKNKKQDMFRVLAIADSIESQMRMNQKEKKLEAHSLDYYACIDYLRVEESFKFTGKGGGMGLGKVQGKFDEKDVEIFLAEHGLRIEQYL